MPNRSSRLIVSIPEASADGRYWGRYPNGDKPVTGIFFAADARSQASVSAAMTAQIKLAGQARVQGLSTAAMNTAIRLAATARDVAAATGDMSANGWANYPTVSIGMAQGPITDNLLNPASWQYIADYDAWAFQWAKATTARLTARCEGIDGVWALQEGTGMKTRFGMYINLNQTTKTQGVVDDPMELLRDIVQSPTEGNPNWYLKNPASPAAILEPNFKPASNRQCNPARGAGLNSLAENLPKAFFRKLKVSLKTGIPATDLHSRLQFWFFDNYNQRVPKIWVNSPASGPPTTPVTSYDMNGDGTADSRANYAATGGSGRWQLGHLDMLAAMLAEDPDFWAMVNSAEWDGDLINGIDPPPLPISTWSFYQKHWMPMAESRHLSLGFLDLPDSYALTPGSLSRLYRGLEIQKLMLKPDPVSTIGRGMAVLHSNTVDRGTGPLTQEDIEYARLMFVLSLLIERCSFSITEGASRPVPLDERNAWLGLPLTVRSMGTLNQATGTFSPLAAMQTNGVGQFWFIQTVEAIAVLRGDYPVGTGARAWPSADPLVNFVLPPAGAGFKWQMFNGANYENPRTNRPMRNQSPSINNGATVTQIPMGCVTGRIAQRVPA